MKVLPDIPVLIWHGCYDGSWRGLIVPEAFAHPAKFAPGLIQRIYCHGMAEGWWRRGDLIGGVALGGVMAGYQGFNWIGVELESEKNDPPGSPFVELGNANLALHGAKWLAMGAASRVVLLQGDSRRFAQIVGKACGIITSPPYDEGLGHGYGAKMRAGDVGRGDQKHTAAMAEGYGSSPGQIQALPSGQLAAVLTSPPYADGGQGGGPDSHPERLEGTADRSISLRGGYGGAVGQIGDLSSGELSAVITSPPWEDQEAAMNAKKFRDPKAFAERMALGSGKGNNHARSTAGALAQLHQQVGPAYGRSDGQIGNIVGETYWQAMHQVYGQCLLALKPGGYMAVVVKDYVKNRRRVPLCDQTLQLLVHVGFAPVCRIHAMLVKESRMPALFGGEHVTKTERKSFFRRLAEKKGSPRIDHEEVLVVRKALP